MRTAHARCASTGPNTASIDSSTRAHAVIRVPVLALKTYKRKRALGGKDLITFYNVMIKLHANLIHHYLIGSPGDGIAVPRSHKELAGKHARNRYEPFAFPRSFPKILDGLSDLGFAKVTLGKYSGFPGQSKRTTVRAGPKLIALIQEHKVTLEDLSGRYDEEIIILSRAKHGYGDEGERIDYKDNATTERFRKELRAINEWLDRADITFDATVTKEAGERAGSTAASSVYAWEVRQRRQALRWLLGKPAEGCAPGEHPN